MVDAATIDALLANPDLMKEALRHLPDAQVAELLKEAENYEVALHRQEAQKNFLPFMKAVWPGFIESAHHRKIARTFDEVIDGPEKRVIINLGPRHTKSESASIHLPAYFFGRFPNQKVIQASYATELSQGFGRKVRNLVNGDLYREIFPETSLSTDSAAAGRWNTNKRGEYFACGTGAGMTGRGADLLIIDDPHSEQDADSPASFDAVYDWYMAGPRPRLQPGGKIIIVMTRWGDKDLTGRLLDDMVKKPGADQWKVIELPAILDEHTERERPLWPGFWSIEELRTLRSTLPPRRWSAQYQQRPTSDEGAIVKRSWWREWEFEKPPRCSFIIQSWDTAHTESTANDASACVTLGVFTSANEKGKETAQIIILDAFEERLEFPELKALAKKEYARWKPDQILIETKASGLPLVQELRRSGLPISEFSPNGKKGKADKTARLNSISDLFYQGRVWAPSHKRWAQRLMDQVASFPFGDSDDLVDALSGGVIRLRAGHLIPLGREAEDEEDLHPARRNQVRRYYG